MKWSLARRVLRIAARVVLGTLIVLLTLVLALLLALDLGPVKSLVRERANVELGNALQGSITLERLGSLGLRGVGGVDATVRDTAGRRVLVLRGVDVGTSWPRIVWSALTGDTLLVDIDVVSIGHADVALIDDGTGKPTLAGAFEPKPKPATPGPATELHVHVERIRASHAWIHGSLGNGPLIDGDVRALESGLHYDAKGLSARLDRAELAVRALPERLDPNGTLSGRLELPSGSGPRGSGRFVGTLAGVKAFADGSWDGSNLRATLSAPDVPPRVVNERLQGLAVRDPARFRCAVEGKWPALRFDGELASHAVRLGVRGQALLGDSTQLSAVVDADEVDVSRLVRAAPASALSLHAEIGVRAAPSGELEGDYRLEIPAGRLDAAPTPPIHAKGRARRASDGELVADGEVRVDEPGAAVDVLHRVHTKHEAVFVHVELAAKVQDPPRLRAFGVRAFGELTASGDFDAQRGTLDARARLRVTSLHHEAVRAHAIALDAKFEGPASDPRVGLDLSAGPVDAVGRRFEEIRVGASGKRSGFAVRGHARAASPRRIELETRVSFADALELDHPVLTLRNDEDSLQLAATKVRASAGRLRVDEFSLRGAGEARGDFELEGARQRVELSATKLELGRIARFAGVRVPFERAVVSTDVSLERRGDTLKGRLHVEADEMRVSKLETSSKADLAFDGRDVSGTAEVDFGEGGRCYVELDQFRLPREPWTLERFARQPGSLVARGDLRLSRFLPLIVASGLPIERISGRARFDVNAAGSDDSKGPRIEARLETRALRVVERRPEKPQPEVRSAETARRTEPRVLEDVDVRAVLTVEQEDGELRVDVELFDPYGTIVSLESEARLPPNWPRTLAASWRKLPLYAKLEMPRRPFEIFPRILRPAAQKGIASARIEVQGSLAEPVVDAELHLDKLRTLRTRSSGARLSAAVVAHYERARGSLALTAEATGRSVGKLDATWRGDAARLASVRPHERSPILLDVDAELREFPLGTIPALVDRQIRGPLSGSFRLEGFGQDPKLAASLDGSRLKIGRVKMERLRAELGIDDGRVRAQIQSGDSKGQAELAVETNVTWGDRLLPRPPDRAEGHLKAQAFRLEVLNPLLSSYLNEVGGRLDADLDVRLEPGRTALSGKASVSEGILQVPQIGQRFTGVTGRVRIEGNRVVAEDIAARGATGRLTAQASAELDGLELRSVNAQLAIAKKQKLPVTFEGVSLGDAWGHAEVKYRTARDGATEIDIEVPALHVELAEQGDFEVQDLEPVESIRIGATRSDGTFSAIAVQPLESAEGGEESSATRIRVRLGRDVEIERGRALKVKMAGEIAMASNGETEVNGRLELRGGTLDVQGKLFDIERGVVTFAGDSSNPSISAIARWDSPEGYTVYAEYSGDVKNGKITLRSEPPLTQDEIASLLLFGTPEGSTGSESGADPNAEAASAAVGVAGDTAARGINRAISNLTKVDVSARVDTSTGNPRPELVVQVTPRVAARVTRAVGEPQAGQPPDRTFLTVEWRFTRSWSVSAVVGDHGGSGMDVIWRRRY